MKETGYYPVSLGANCFPRMYIEPIYKQSYPRLPFDYVGSPMWGINQAIKEDFKQFASKDTIDMLHLYKNTRELYLVNRNYRISFMHDHFISGNKDIKKISNSDYSKVEIDYSRRVERWNTLLTSGSKILFFRLERLEQNRIYNPENINKPSEKDSLEEFSKMMKEKGVEFRIVYVTYNNSQYYDLDTRIIYVNIPSKEKYTDRLLELLFRDVDVLNYLKHSLA